MGKFPRSMSDFKPGEKHRSTKGKLATLAYNGQAIGCPELTATPASTGFIMCRKETHGALYVLPANYLRRRKSHGSKRKNPNSSKGL